MDEQSFVIFLSKKVMNDLARLEAEREFGKIGGLLRERSDCKVDQSFLGWFSQSVTSFLK